MRAAVFLERDGLLCAERVGRGQPEPPLALADFKINTEAAEPLRQLKAAGFLLVATTNQPALSNGLLPRRELDLMNELLRRYFELDDLLICPHDAADCCPCRKPKPGLLTEAAFKWHINLDQSYVISNKWQDAHAAQLAGCTSLLIASPWLSNGHRDMVQPDLPSAVQRVLRLGLKKTAMVA